MRNVLLVLALLALCAAPVPASGATGPDFFPLQTGAYWVFEGPVKWTRPNSPEVVEQVLSCKMEVVETIERQHVLGAVLKGHPMDLAWYEDGKQAGDYLIVRVGEHQYYLLTGPRMQDALLKLRDPDDVLADLVHDDEMFLDLPLTEGKVFGETFQITRQDLFYAWTVDGEGPASLSGVRGIPGAAAATEYRVVMRTLPAGQEAWYVPGIGLTRYAYRHHGTVAEADLKLIEYHPGS